MSTEYILAKGQGKELSLDEHSNEFDLGFFQGEQYTNIYRDMTVDNLKELVQGLTNTISYFDGCYEGTKPSYFGKSHIVKLD